MTATIQKWGNSLALRLPKTLADDANIAEGTRVELVRTAEGVLLKTRPKPSYRLSELLKGINAKNRHGETEWGRPSRREIVK
jgi:antitoxin MazE